MPPSGIILIGVLVQLTAAISSVYAPRLQLQLGLTNAQFLLRIVLLAQLLPLYVCIGLLLPFGGLRSSGEMYVAAAWFGMVCTPVFTRLTRAAIWTIQQLRSSSVRRTDTTCELYSNGGADIPGPRVVFLLPLLAHR